LEKDRIVVQGRSEMGEMGVVEMLRGGVAEKLGLRTVDCLYLDVDLSRQSLKGIEMVLRGRSIF
jgi:hypothetical protein